MEIPSHLLPPWHRRFGYEAATNKCRAIADLSLIAFYYLLRVGEYTKPRFVIRNGSKVRTTRTKQFSYYNVGFYKDDKIVSRSSALEILLTCDAATLKITNQKNGRMGQTIHQKKSGSDCCPVKALAHRIAHINAHRSEGEDRLLSDYFVHDAWHSISVFSLNALGSHTLQTQDLTQVDGTPAPTLAVLAWS